MSEFGRASLEAAVKDHPESIPARVILNNFEHFVNIHNILGGKWEYGWGSYMFDGRSYEWQRATLKKQEALFRVGEQTNNILEIGVYLGHSLLILLISCVDNDARFAPKVVEYLNAQFGNRVTFFLGDAVDVINSLPSYSKFDMVHVDADHNNDAVLKQYHAARKFTTDDAYFVFDDYEATRGAVDSLLNTNVLKKMVLPMCLWTNIVTQLN